MESSKTSYQPAEVLDIKQLIPIQGGLLLSDQQLLDIKVDLSDNPIITVPYTGRKGTIDERHLILDGHHQARRELLLGEIVIEAIVLRSDDDIRAQKLTSLAFCNSVDDVHDTYEKHWKENAERKGVRNVATLGIPLL